MLWFLLIFSVLGLLASIYLIKEHNKLNAAMDDYNCQRKVGYDEYVVTGLFGYLGLPGSIFAICCCIYLLIIDYIL